MSKPEGFGKWTNPPQAEILVGPAMVGAALHGGAWACALDPGPHGANRERLLFTGNVWNNSSNDNNHT